MARRRLTLYIGRFSPPHLGHCETAQRAIDCSDHVLIVIGSANQPRTIKNPWNAEERKDMLLRALGYPMNVSVRFQRDHPYNESRWLAEVQQYVNEANNEFCLGDADIYITGADRDSSTFYLREFPQYKLDLVAENTDISQTLSSTSIRDIYFARRLNGRHLTNREVDVLVQSFVPKATMEFMHQFEHHPAMNGLQEDWEFHYEHALSWQGTPHPVLFQTVDSVVIQTGHVLLVQRKKAPGKGLWALPGGYLKSDEWMLDGAIRELREETKLTVPEPVLRGALKTSDVFDDPRRSQRGRIVTRAFLFHLPDYAVDGKIILPKVKGSDDAAKAKWFELSRATDMTNEMFEDHPAIIDTMIGRL